MTMAPAPRYAFIVLEPGQSKRDVFVNLSNFGDVRLMDKISEVSTLLTSLVVEMENAPAKTVAVVEPPAKRPPIVPQPITMLERYPRPAERISAASRKRELENFIATAKKAVGAEHIQPDPLPRRPPTDVSANHLQLHLSAPNPLPLFADTDKKDELISEFKTEEDPLDFSTGQMEGYKEDDGDEDEEQVNSGYGDDELQRQLEEMSEQPCSSTSLSDPIPDELTDMDLLADEDGMIEVPYKPNFSECKPKRKNPNPEYLVDSAQCDVCKRWVKCTNNLTRLIAHVFTHVQTHRFVCPFEECEYSNKTEPITRRHILAAHGKKMDPVDISKDKRKHSESWKASRTKWAPRCFPNHFETTPEGEIFMRIDEKMIFLNSSKTSFIGELEKMKR